jgi:membrane protein DedA with SNARE-associated domain
MDVVALLTFAAILFIKEAGLPLPVPGDLLVVGAGVSTSGRSDAIAWLAAVLIAGYAGGCVQFLLIRGPMRRPILGLLARVGLGEQRLAALAAPLSRRGARGVAIARATPGVRVPVIAASAIAALPFGVFVPGLIAGNTVFVGGHFALGFVVGAPATRIAGAVASPAALVVAIGILAIGGALGWVALRARREAPGGHDESALPSWADAACPICLSIAALESRGTPPRADRRATPPVLRCRLRAGPARGLSGDAA